MSHNQDHGCATPINKRTRSLGLRKTASMTCGAAINYKPSKEQKIEAETSTPQRSVSERLTASTNCRPYRLALSKTMREKLTKKRLEFHLANNDAAQQSTHNGGGGDDSVAEEPQVLLTPTTNNELELKTTKESCIEEAEQKHQQQKYKSEEQQHESKVEELKAAIEMWKTAFVAALDELHQTQPIEPKMDKAALLQQLQIPMEMLKYVVDE